MRKLSMSELGRLDASALRTAEKSRVLLVLENIRSMHNVGSIFRTADAFRAEGIVLCGYTPAPPHRDIHKTALGATETVAWRQAADPIVEMTSLKDKGYFLLAAEQVEGAMPLHALELPAAQPCALILGNEVEGISPATLALCDAAVEIPQFGAKHSLNVSVAAGVILWELTKKMFIHGFGGQGC